LKVTPVVRVRFVPRITTSASISPDAGIVATNG
jgi:hypothetical protein